ncbi:MAG: MFS transporter [Pirellulaceae bacterium]|nr:MFS transporter [Pirellulaceae bacterium]
MNQAKMTTDRSGLLLVAAGLAQFIVCADWWSASVALPPMAKDLGVRTIDLQWVITGYVLTFCAMLGVAGPLGDRFGRKKLLLWGIVIFAVVSIWVGLATNAAMLILARIFQGIGAGLIMPLATAVVSHASSEKKLARNIALLTGVAMFGAAVGPVLGGFLTQYFSWRWIFFINVPICGVAFFMVSLFAQESKDSAAHGRLDLAGIFLLLVGISALSVGIDRVPHWSSTGWLSLLVAGLGFLIAFVWWELRIQSPIIDFRMFQNRRFVGFTLGGLAGNSAWCVLVFGSTLQLQQVLGYEVLNAGLFFLFLSGSVAIASFIAPLLEQRLGTKALLWIGLLCQLTGIGLLFLFDSEIPLASGMVIAGIGCSWTWAMPQAGAIKELPREKVGLASGTVLTVMVMGGNTAIVIVAMIIDLYPKTKAGEASGIQTGFLLASLTAALGLIVTVAMLKGGDRSPNSKPAT